MISTLQTNINGKLDLKARSHHLCLPETNLTDKNIHWFRVKTVETTFQANVPPKRYE
jgi:hypothetical protein